MWKRKETKPLTESLTSISIVKLRQHPAFRVGSSRAFALGSVQVKLVSDQLAQDTFLELLDRGANCSNSAITLLQTRCNYGGSREWFQCPGCSSRAGVLYLQEDNFKCRQCLDLRYLSQRMNYGTLVPTIKRWAKFEKMDPRRCRTYKGRPTRYTRQYEKLQAQVAIGMDLFGPRYTSG